MAKKLGSNEGIRFITSFCTLSQKKSQDWQHVKLRKTTCNARHELMRSYLATASSQSGDRTGRSLHVAGFTTQLG
jgi:hypothetical protein